MRTFLRGRVRLLVLAFAVVLAIPAVALASDVSGSVVDTTAPTGSVTLSAGNSGNIQINYSVTGAQEGTATFDVYKDWTLSGGTFTGSNPVTVTVPPRANGQDAPPAQTGTINGTVSVDSGQAAGGPFTLQVAAFNITNTNATGAKLSAGTFSTYNVTVQGVTDPCAGVSNPDAPVISGTPDTPDGLNGWYTSVPSVSASSATSGATIEYATKSLPGGTKSAYSSTPPTLTDGSTEVFAKATSATCNRVSESSRVFNVDTTAPDVNPASVVDNVWRNSSLSQAFTSSDATSGLADSANDASFTLTAANESADANTPTVVSRTVYDVAGNSTTRSVSAKIDLTKPNLGITDNNLASTGICDTAHLPTEPTFNPTDALSGVASQSSNWVNNTAPSGLGSYTYKASATDTAGNTAYYPGPGATDVKTYTVVPGSAYSGILQPINLTGTRSAFKLGSTIPVKFTLSCGAGKPINNSVAKLYLSKTDATADPVNEPISTNSPDIGNTFRVTDTTTGQYQFNLSTKAGYSVPGPNGGTVSMSEGTWYLYVQLDGGAKFQAASFDIKK